MKFLLLLFMINASAPENLKSDYFIQFDTVRVDLAKVPCNKHSDFCHFHILPKGVLQQYQPKKIINTNIPKFIKIESAQDSYWFKIWNT